MLMMALYCPFPDARAPLKLGQNNQRKRVPGGGGGGGGGGGQGGEEKVRR